MERGTIRWSHLGIAGRQSQNVFSRMPRQTTRLTRDNVVLTLSCTLTRQEKKERKRND